MDGRKAAHSFSDDLAKVLAPYREGGCPVCIDYQNTLAQGMIKLGDKWRVHPAEELMHRLRNLVGKENVAVVYQ